MSSTHIYLYVITHCNTDYIIGKSGCKQKDIIKKTNCKFVVIRHSPDTETNDLTNKMKIEFFKLNDNATLNVAKIMVVSSIIEFIGDEKTNGKLLFELTPSRAKEPVLVRHRSFVRQYDPDPATKQLWIQSLDLPYHRQRKQYHGKCLQINKDLAKTINEEECQMHLIGGDFENSPAQHPDCEPYVLILGTKKANVIRVVQQVKQVMVNHQVNCGCEPVDW